MCFIMINEIFNTRYYLLTNFTRQLHFLFRITIFTIVIFCTNCNNFCPTSLTCNNVNILIKVIFTIWLLSRCLVLCDVFNFPYSRFIPNLINTVIDMNKIVLLFFECGSFVIRIAIYYLLLNRILRYELVYWWRRCLTWSNLPKSFWNLIILRFRKILKAFGYYLRYLIAKLIYTLLHLRLSLLLYCSKYLILLFNCQLWQKLVWIEALSCEIHWHRLRTNLISLSIYIRIIERGIWVWLLKLIVITKVNLLYFLVCLSVDSYFFLFFTP